MDAEEKSIIGSGPDPTPIPETGPSAKLKKWVVEQVESRHTSTWLFLLSFAESSFFPIPPDFFMFPVILRKPLSWARVAGLVTLASVFGGIVGYAIGLFAYELLAEPLISFYHLEEKLQIVSGYFNNNAFLAILTAAFTPIPYKLFTIAAGLFKIDFLTFVVASVIGRGLRFFIVAFIIRVFGAVFSKLIFKYFNYLTAFLAVVAVGYILMSIF